MKYLLDTNICIHYFKGQFDFVQKFQEKARLSSIVQLIRDCDLLIGATAIAYDMIMVTRNIKEFERLSDIQLENWIDDYHRSTLRDEI